eukprot:TRINITY_DN34791_c1_g1_i5.p1 TRINITY_DN34791_c1_g1~~TRINITY_DN34791_c1_g1_i5.p1  ORF type:complete len:126 (-),score=17.92 TRINITY_DN34791_c1_g1_i5:302-679(-)
MHTVVRTYVWWCLCGYRVFHFTCFLYAVLLFSEFMGTVSRSGDLKPPTSPSPGAPTISLISTPPIESNLQRPSMDASSTSQVPSTDKPVDKQHLNQPKMQPLSPFTMYEDLKPPSSPMPSSPIQH